MGKRRREQRMTRGESCVAIVFVRKAELGRGPLARRTRLQEVGGSAVDALLVHPELGGHRLRRLLPAIDEREGGTGVRQALFVHHALRVDRLPLHERPRRRVRRRPSASAYRDT